MQAWCCSHKCSHGTNAISCILKFTYTLFLVVVLFLQIYVYICGHWKSCECFWFDSTFSRWTSALLMIKYITSEFFDFTILDDCRDGFYLSTTVSASMTTKMETTAPMATLPTSQCLHLMEKTPFPPHAVSLPHDCCESIPIHWVGSNAFWACHCAVTRDKGGDDKGTKF